VLFHGKSARVLGALAVAAVALASAPGMAVAGPAHRPVVRASLSGPHDVPTLITSGRRPASIFVQLGLNGVFCTSAVDCWAVGATSASGAELNQALHWDGTSWSPAVVPSPGGTQSGAENELLSVRCTGPKNCWAVGDYESQDQDKANLDQILHWNGKKWQLTPSPQPGGKLAGDQNKLLDVACTSRASCWAVGLYGAITKPSSSSVTELNLALHWNGRTWAKVPVPNPAGTTPGQANAIGSVRCPSPADCWAVGADGTISDAAFSVRNELLHWNGKKWGTATVPSPGPATKGRFSELSSLSCTSAVNCWAAGFSEIPDEEAATEIPGGIVPAPQNQLVHWNGKKWRAVTVPHPGGAQGDQLASVSCSSATDCWAVGSIGVGTELNEALHWNGSKWSAAGPPNPGGKDDGDKSALTSVRCISPRNCWAVGSQKAGSGPQLNQILHFTGRKWFVR
jgi:hypothetical protein